MTMTTLQREKTLAIRDNLVGSEDVRTKAAHALDHDDPSCLDCAAWRGRPDIFKAASVGAGDHPQGTARDIVSPLSEHEHL